MYLSHVPISSGYGPRPQFNDFHYGVDYACPVGTKLPALVDGRVIFEGHIPAAMAGYPAELIVILQADGYFIVYGHLSQTLVNAGQWVKQGDIIALSGNSGYTSGPHLHIERRRGTKEASKGLLAYPSEDITPLLEAYGQSAQGGANDMTFEDYANNILDVIADEPNYADNKRAAWNGHVAWLKAETPKDWAAPRKWAKGIMHDSGVLNATQMREHVVADEKALAKLEDENTRIRTDFTKRIEDLQGKLEASDEANQMLASQANEASALVKQKVEESNRLKDEVRELKEQLAARPADPGTTQPIEQYSGLELIRMGINKWLKFGT